MMGATAPVGLPSDLRFAGEADSAPVAAIAPALEILATIPENASVRPLLDLWTDLCQVSGLPERHWPGDLPALLDRHWGANAPPVSTGAPPHLIYSNAASIEDLPSISARFVLDTRMFQDAPRAASLQLVLPAGADWGRLSDIASGVAHRWPHYFRWIVSGYRFVGLRPEAARFLESLRIIRSRARRFRGPDLEDPAGGRTALGWFQLRSINWLVILAPGFVGDASHIQDAEVDGLRIDRLGDCLRFQAGVEPVLADANRREDSAAYRRMDAMFRLVRVNYNMPWYEPWTQREFRKWLERWNADWVDGD